MCDDHSDFLIKSAALLAKDLLVENKLFTINADKTDADSDDDLDLFFYSQLMKKRKVSDRNNLHTETVEKQRLGILGKRGSTSNRRVATAREGPPMKHLFLKFLQECEDITFENQFKMTRSTFQVRKLIVTT